MTLTRAETCSLWRGALLGLHILKSKAERDSPLGSQPLMLYRWPVHSEADRPQRWTLDEPLQLIPFNSLILEKETGPERGFGFLKIIHPVVHRAEFVSQLLFLRARPPPCQSSHRSRGISQCFTLLPQTRKIDYSSGL